MDFKDISTEQYRAYVFPGGDTVTVTEPLKLFVSNSGGHRIVDASGTSHYLPARWIHLSWKVKAGQPEFSF